jgi:hypothetical protein
MEEEPMSILLSAKKYARMGWDVFPAPPGTKKSYKSQEHSGGAKWGKTRDIAQIEADWAQWPDANIGLPCGKESGFWVMEADTSEGHGVDGLQSIRDLVARHGDIPPTRMAESPSGSVHYYFKWVEGVEITNSVGRIAPGIDVRGQGGMVIAPPSIRHGQAYKWLNELQPVEAPPWVLAAALEASRRVGPRPGGTGQQQADVPRLRDAIRVIPNQDVDWERWNTMAMALYASTGGSSEGMNLFIEWSAKSTKHNEQACHDKWRTMGVTPPTSIGAGTIFFMATEASPGWDRIVKEDFYAYMPNHDYIYIHTRDHWPAASVNAKLGKIRVNDDLTINAGLWLDQNRSVEQITWAPGSPMVIKDKVVADGGWVDRRGARTFNTYRPPLLVKGKKEKAWVWLNHIERIYPNDKNHIVSWLAHRMQRPEEKINHALVLGGAPGIGKDTILEPVKRAIGHWNFGEASPQGLLGNFNASYLSNVILRISEARDLGAIDKYKFYEHMKPYTAAPPDALKVNEKHVKEYYVFNCVGIVYTTNYKQGGIYLPKDDRRHYMAWSDVLQSELEDDYGKEIWDWINSGGDAHVAAYLAELDISRFDAKATPFRTPAFWEVAQSSDSHEDMELADALDAKGNPDATTVADICTGPNAVMMTGGFVEWFTDRKNRGQVPHLMDRAGYARIRNPDASDGVWKVNQVRTVIYAKKTLLERDQIAAARGFKTRMERVTSGLQVVGHTGHGSGGDDAPM